MTVDSKAFKVKNGLVVQGSSATVAGNEVLTTASELDDLFDVNAPTPADGDSLVYDTTTQKWIPAAGGVGEQGPPGIVAQDEPPVSTDVLWLDTDAEAAIPAGPSLTVNDVARMNGWADNTIEPRARGLTTANTSVTSGSLYITWFTPATNITVSSISMASGGTASSSVTSIRMGLYETTDDGTTATLLARTDNDATLFTTSNTVYTRSFSTTGDYPASVTLIAGNRYGIAHFVNATTSGTRIMFTSLQATLAALEPSGGSLKLSQTDLPASLTSLAKTGANIWGRLS